MLASGISGGFKRLRASLHALFSQECRKLTNVHLRKQLTMHKKGWWVGPDYPYDRPKQRFTPRKGWKFVEAHQIAPVIINIMQIKKWPARRKLIPNSFFAAHAKHDCANVIKEAQMGLLQKRCETSETTCHSAVLATARPKSPLLVLNVLLRRVPKSGISVETSLSR